MRGDLARKVAARTLTVVLAGMAFLVLALAPWTTVGALLVAVDVLAALAERRVRPAADLVAEQIMLASGVPVAYAARRDVVDWMPVLAGAALMGLILLERPLRDAAAQEIRSAHPDVRRSPAQAAERLDVVVPVLLGLLALAAAAGLPSRLVLITGSSSSARRPSTGSPATPWRSRRRSSSSWGGRRWRTSGRPGAHRLGWPIGWCSTHPPGPATVRRRTTARCGSVRNWR